MLKDLVKLANDLDSKGLIKEADDLDRVSRVLLKKATGLESESVPIGTQPSDDLIISFEKLKDLLEKEFPEEMLNGQRLKEHTWMTPCRLLEEGRTESPVAITVKKDWKSGLPDVGVIECSYMAEKKYNSEPIYNNIYESLYRSGFRINKDRQYADDEVVENFFEPILKERESFNPKKNIDGTWIHVLNEKEQISSAEDFNKFLAITGEVSVSSWDPAISRGYFVRSPRNYKSSFAIIISGKASYCWGSDIWSIVDPRTGLRTPTRPKSYNSNHDECFLVPAKSKPIMALVGPDADQEEAKGFVQAAEAIGLPVQIMSLRPDSFLNNKREEKYDEWLDYEDFFEPRVSNSIKALVKLANHLDQKGLIKEADALDFLIENNIKKQSGYMRDYAKHSALNLGQVLRHLRYLTDLPDTPRVKATKQRLRWIANDLYYTVTPGQWHHTQDELDELSGFTYADLLRMGFDPDFADKLNKGISPE